MSDIERPLVTLEELRELAEDVLRATYQTYEPTLQRFIAPLDPAEPLGALADEILTEVDFEMWYQQAKGPGGSMVGSGKLDFPVDRSQRVSLQLKLLRRISSGAIDVHHFCADFLWVENDLNANLDAFNQQVFRPFFRDFQRTLEPHLSSALLSSGDRTTGAAPLPSVDPPINPERIAALRRIQDETFDLRKLIRLCEEMNICYAHSCVFAVAMLTRAVLDHIPPIFGFTKFIEVVNNHNGGKSFSASMKHLQGSARNIADAHLHNPIRNRESLPNLTQVNFANDLDVLLAEIERRLG